MQRSLEQEVAHLKRRLEREKKARESAEQLLDDYAKKTFIANEKLRDAVAEVEHKQQEIEFFVKSTTESTSAESNQTLVESLLGLCATFTDAKFAASFYINNGMQCESPRVIRNSFNTTQVKDIEQLIPFDTEGLLPYWCIQELTSSEADNLSTWLVYSNFQYVDGIDGWLAMLIDSAAISEEKLYVLDAHIAQLRHSLEKLNNKSDTEQIDGLKVELSDARKQLTIADRMSSLGLLASGVAHEINNPLAFISANNRYLKQALLPAINGLKQIAEQYEGTEAGDAIQNNNLVRLEETIAEVLQDNMDGIDRLSKISDSLRKFVHTGADELSAVNVNDVVSNVVKMASFSKQNSQRIDVDYASGSANVNANLGELEQVLLNITINALHATETSGSVNISVNEQDDSVCIHVKDNGVGISKENMAKIFSPFFTTKEVGKGTGLGLAISKSIVEAHGGSLDVESELGQGTCFTIALPKVMAAVNAEAME